MFGWSFSIVDITFSTISGTGPLNVFSFGGLGCGCIFYKFWYLLGYLCLNLMLYNKGFLLWLFDLSTYYVCNHEYFDPM